MRSKDKRVKNTKIYRISEFGDGLQFLRYKTNLGYILSPEPNTPPIFLEYYLNTQEGGRVTQHSNSNIAQALNNAEPCDLI